MFGVFPRSLHTDRDRRYESGVCIGPELQRGVKAQPAKAWQHRLEVLRPGERSRLRSEGGSVTEHRKAGPGNKILMTPFFANSFKLSEKLSPFDHNTEVGPAVVLNGPRTDYWLRRFRSILPRNY